MSDLMATGPTTYDLWRSLVVRGITSLYFATQWSAVGEDDIAGNE